MAIRGEATCNVITRVPYQRLHEMLTLAFEGASLRWIKSYSIAEQPEEEVQHVQDAPFYNGTIKIETFDQQERVVDLQSLVTAAQKMADKCRHHFYDMINEKGDNDTADVFVQLLCFGEVVHDGAV